MLKIIFWYYISTSYYADIFQLTYSFARLDDFDSSKYLHHFIQLGINKNKFDLGDLISNKSM